jgi:Ca2+-binding EF-hand superfamily protein
MSSRLYQIIACLIFSLLIFHSNARVEPGPGVKHADRNKNGVVDRQELRMEKAWERRQRSNVNAWWESRADTNKDGRVDAGELSAWRILERERLDLDGDGVISPRERRCCWMHVRSRVNTSLESTYDENGDGWLQPDEVKELLKDRYTLIKTQGKARVDSPIEEEYDTDGDGIIDDKEAGALIEDLE